MSGTSQDSCAYAEPHRAHDWWPRGDQSQARRRCPGTVEAAERAGDRAGRGPEAEPARPGRA